MSNRSWRPVSGFVVLVLVSCAIYGCEAREKKFAFDCSGPSKLVVIPFSTNPYPAPNTGTLVCSGDTLKWQSDVPSVSFTIAFETADCFDVQSYPSSGGVTTPTVGIRNPGTPGIGECKYSIIDAGGHTHDPHVIIMK